MIKKWRHKGLQRFYETGKKSGIQAKHKKTLKVLLFQLVSAIRAEDMDTPGNDFHKLKGNLKDFYAVKVSGNWRIIFRFEGEYATDVDYIDYH